MNFFLLNEISTYSILIAAILSLARYRKSIPLYRTFLWLIWLQTANELLSMALVYIFGTNMINANIYVLLEYALLLLLFYRWNLDSSPKKYVWLMAVGILVWVSDNMVLHSPNTINSLFRVFYSIIILFLSIHLINRLILNEKNRLISNPQFLVCLAFVIFYSYKAFIETFYILQPPLTKLFYLELFQVLLFVNLFTNLIYAFVILCLPTKRAFSLPY